MNRLFQVFRTGTHIDSAGVERTFTAADLRAIADKFDPDLGAVPIVKGHPATDDPAYGWISRFMFEETSGILYAVPSDVDNAFKAEVNAKRFHRVSLALYTPESPSNPSPGTYYPRHVGFLGAAAPGVKGLKAANFNDNDGDFLMFDLNNEADVSKFTDFLGKTLVKLGFKPASAEPGPGPNEPPDPKKSSEYLELETERVKLETDLKAERETNATAQAKTARASVAAFAEKLTTEGRITPIEAGRLVEILFAMEAVTGEIEFTEGKDKTAVKGTAQKLLMGVLEKLPVRIHFDELGAPSTDGVSHIGFTAPPGAIVSSGEKLDLHRRAVAYAAKHKVEYIDAVSILEGATQ